jgi:hypothetical protein
MKQVWSHELKVKVITGAFIYGVLGACCSSLALRGEYPIVDGLIGATVGALYGSVKPWVGALINLGIGND